MALRRLCPCLLLVAMPCQTRGLQPRPSIPAQGSSGLHPPLFVPFHFAKPLGKVFLKVTFKSKTHA